MKNDLIKLLLLFFFPNTIHAQCDPVLAVHMTDSCAPLQVTFNIPGMNSGTVSWSSGTTTANGFSFSHVFQYPGNYTITCNVVMPGPGGVGTCTGTASKVMHVVTGPAYGCSTTVGLIELSTEPVGIYPNPNNGTFNIKRGNYSEDTEVIIVNCLGEIVHKEKLINEKTIVTSPLLNKGIYFARVYYNKNLHGTTKIVVE